MRGIGVDTKERGKEREEKSTVPFCIISVVCGEVWREGWVVVIKSFCAVVILDLTTNQPHIDHVPKFFAVFAGY